MSGEEAAQEVMRLQQGLEQFSMQKKQFQSQLAETEAALAATERSGDAYRIIGNLMVKQPSGEIKKDLSEKKETLAVRIKAIDKQEEKLRSQLKQAQEAVMQRQEKK